MAQDIVSPQMLSVFTDSPVLSAVPLSSQVEVLERLKYLRAWQQQQQEVLLRRQQEQLMKLKGEQEASNEAVSSTSLITPEREPSLASFQGSTGKERLDTESPLVSDGSHDESCFPYVPLIDSPLSLANDNDILERGGADSNTNQSTGEHQLLITPTVNRDDRPLKPAAVTGTFDDLVESQLNEHQADTSLSISPDVPSARKPFLRKGQGVARFGMKKFHIRHKDKSEFKGQIAGATNKELETLPSFTGTQQSSSSGIVQSRVRKVSRASGIMDNHYLLPNSPSMVRCSSEDSFIIRRNNRLQQEQEELSEFEYLEQMSAANGSSSSQSSLLISHTPCTTDDFYTCTPQGTTFDEQRLSYAPQKNMCVENTAPAGNLSSPALVENIPSNLRKAPMLISNQCISNDARRRGPPASDGDVPLIMRSLSESLSDSEMSVDLDETLTPLSPSQAHTVEFNDDEVWDSFNHGSPQSVSGQSKRVLSHWKSPVRRERLDEGGKTVFTTSLPATMIVEDQSSVDDTDTGRSEQARSSDCADDRPTLATQLSMLSHEPLPPPSALVAKLFPALRKKEEYHHPGLASNDEQPAPMTKTPSPSSSTSGGDSGKGSLSSASALMNEELKKKLCQLELEIEKYKVENTSLEKLRKEREEELSHLKAEVSEFKQQKDEEIQRFEEYKKDETRKLKRDRKIFESYQVEARTARDKRDKEDILALRKELEEVRDELQKKESRWGTTLSRYRIKIEGLEARNKELMNDIKMMEEARLEWWQEQINQQSNHHKKTLLPTNDEKGRTKHSSKVGVAVRRKTAGKQPSKKSLKRTSSDQCDSTITVEESSSDDIHYSDTDTWSGEENPSGNSTSEMASPEIIDVISNDYDRGSEEEDITTLADGIVNEMLGAESAKVETIDSQQPAESSPQRKKKSVQFNISVPSQSPETHSSATHGGMMESVLEDGSKVVRFANGNRKVLGKDGKTESVYFFNGDVKHTKPDKTVEYFYFESKVTHTTYPDGLQVFNFPNHQTEKHYPNGTKEILFPNKTLKYVHPNGDEESVFPDGTVQRVQPNGDLTIEYSNGQRDTHTKEYKRRQYPDGSVKTVYRDGRQETRYPTGRVRVKDKSGKILVDELHSNNSLTQLKKPTANN